MSGFTEIPVDVEDWQNPIPDLLLDHLDIFEAMDTLAARHEQAEGALPPTEMLGKLAEIDVVAIGRSAIRLHNTAQHHFRSIIDDAYEDLMGEHWSGNLADTFRNYMEGGNGFHGVDQYLRLLRTFTEQQARAFLNMGEYIKEQIEDLVPALRELLGNVETYVQMDEQASGVKHFIDEVLIGKFLIRAHPVLAALALAISWTLESFFRVGKSLEGSRAFLTNYDHTFDAYGQPVSYLGQISW